MYKFYKGELPSTFDNFFTPVNETHAYSTRLSTRKSYSLPKTRTNYGIFNIRFQGPKSWNAINESHKSESRLSTFKRKLKEEFLEKY